MNGGRFTPPQKSLTTGFVALLSNDALPGCRRGNLSFFTVGMNTGYGQTNSRSTEKRYVTGTYSRTSTPRSKTYHEE